MSYYRDMGNKYEQIPELILDLHGYTTSECKDALDELISEGAHKHIRIITGRGKRSPNGPVLPTYVKNYLDDRSIRWNQSKIADGGEGSLEVFL